MGDSANQRPAYVSQLTGDLQPNTFFDRFPSVSDLGKFALESEGKLTDFDTKLKSAVVLPGEGAKDEEWNPIYQKLGMPESMDKYSIKKPEDWPTDLPYDPNGETWFRDIAFKNRLTDKQAASVHSEYLSLIKTMKTQDDARREKEKDAALSTLKQEWGEDGWKANLVFVDQALQAFGDDDFKKYMDESGLGNDPRIIRAFSKIGAAMAEDKFVRGRSAPAGGPEKDGVLTYPSMEGK
jgi:hypothetical protein